LPRRSRAERSGVAGPVMRSGAWRSRSAAFAGAGIAVSANANAAASPKGFAPARCFTRPPWRAVPEEESWEPMRSSRQGTFPPGNRPQGPAPPGGVGSVAFFRRNHRRGSMGWHACGQGDGFFHASECRRESRRRFRALALSTAIAARVSFQPLTRNGRAQYGVRCGGKMPVTAARRRIRGGT